MLGCPCQLLTLGVELARRFQIRRSHIIIVSGNHDLNWELGDKAFSYDENRLPKRDLTQHQRPTYLFEL
jgi:hypothetical protein